MGKYIKSHGNLFIEKKKTTNTTHEQDNIGD